LILSLSERRTTLKGGQSGRFREIRGNRCAKRVFNDGTVADIAAPGHLTDNQTGAKMQGHHFSYFTHGYIIYLSFGKSVSPELVVAGGLGLLIQIFTVLPWGYRTLAAVDRFLAVVLGIVTSRGEVRP
jgi:hypothetical protein